MAKKKGIQVNSMIKDAQAQKWGCFIDGRPVSEHKFFLNLRRELRGEKVRKTFYWTDKKVMEAIKLSGARITTKFFKQIKDHLTNP